MNDALRMFMYNLRKELDKIIDDSIKIDSDLWITYSVGEKVIDMSIYIKHKLGYSLYFCGMLETQFVKILYEKVEAGNSDALNVSILLRDNLGITHLNTHIQAIANLIKSLIEM